MNAFLLKAATCYLLFLSLVAASDAKPIIQSFNVDTIDGKVGPVLLWNDEDPGIVTSYSIYAAEIDTNDLSAIGHAKNLTFEKIGSTYDMNFQVNTDALPELYTKIYIYEIRGTIVKDGTYLTSSNHAASVYGIGISAHSAIISKPVTEAALGALYVYDVHALADGLGVGRLPITYQLRTAPQGMGIFPFNGIIMWTPDSTGVFEVSVKATDAETGEFELQTWTILVAG